MRNSRQREKFLVASVIANARNVLHGHEHMLYHDFATRFALVTLHHECLNAHDRHSDVMLTHVFIPMEAFRAFV
jgi:hypothetical protein